MSTPDQKIPSESESLGSSAPGRDYSGLPLAPSTIVRVEVPLPCVECGYELRGIDESAACPECGTPVARSTSRDLLRFSPMEYLESLATGGRWVMTSLGGMFAAAILMMVIPLAGALAGAAEATVRWAGLAMGTVVGIGLIASGAFWLAGWWKLTAIDASRPVFAQGREARMFVRWAGVASLAVLSLVLVLYFAGVASGQRRGRGLLPNLEFGLQAGCSVFAIVVCTHMVATCLHTRAVFRRIPYPVRAKFAGRIAWVIPVSAACLVLAAVRPIGLAIPALAMLLMLLGGLGAIVSLSLYLSMIADLNAAANRVLAYRKQWAEQFALWDRTREETPAGPTSGSRGS